jgi:hypothetical protein
MSENKPKTVAKCDVRDAYRRAIAKVWHLKQKDIKKDIHIAGKAPGQWVGEHGILEIYCESGIPNASDIQDFSYEAREFGCDPAGALVYHSDQWFEIDKIANLILAQKFDQPYRKFYHEPFNSAVVGVYEV